MINPEVKDKPSTVIHDRQVPIDDPRQASPATGGIIRSWRFVAVVVAACVAATACYVYVVPPKWEASAHILVTPVPADADLPGLALVSESVEPTRSVQTAVALLDTPTAAAATAAQLGAPWSPASVDQSVVLEPLGQSYVVEVKAQADSPEIAARLATTFVESALATRNSEIKKRAATLLAVRNRLSAGTTGEPSSAAEARLELIVRTGDSSLSVAERASTPSSPVGLPALMKIALSAVLGLCLAIAGAWARTRRTRLDNGWDK